MHIDVVIITSDIIKTSNKVSFQRIIGSRIHDEIINDLRVDDFIGVLAKDKFAELSGQNKTIVTYVGLQSPDSGLVSARYHDMTGRKRLIQGLHKPMPAAHSNKRIHQ